MKELSVCMIAKGNEPLINKALSSVKACAEEIILVNTGLDQESKDLVKKFKDSNPQINFKLIESSWNDDFSKSRNESISHASGKWIFVIDSDEVIDTPALARLLEKTKDMTDVLGYTVEQRTYTNDESSFGFIPKGIDFKTAKESRSFKGFYSCNIIRLFKNLPSIRFQNPVHESVDASIRTTGGKIAKTDLKLIHLKEMKPGNTDKISQLQYLRIYEKNLDKFTNRAKALGDLGILYSTYKNDDALAVEKFKEALNEYDKDGRKPNPKVLIGIAQSLMRLKRNDEARTYLELFIDIFPDLQASKNAKALLERTKE